MSTDFISTDCIIIGAGLSGLTSAYYLKKEYGITPLMLEARDRLGGRIKTESSIDLGATWLGKDHTSLLQLLDDLNINTFPQYQSGRGLFVHSTVEPHHYFDAEANGNPTFRISGGSAHLVDVLAEQLNANMQFNQPVKEIYEQEDHLKIITDKKIYHTGKAAITIPPQLAAKTIRFTPALPDTLWQVMNSTHTWMSNAIKIGLIYKRPFWREQNLAGTLIAPNGPVIEMYDHSRPKDNFYALMGFANEALREYHPEKRKKIITEFLASCFGDEATNYQTYKENDWLKEKYTATDQSHAFYMHPTYGSALWEKSYFGSKLFFGGSETADSFGGYMEGAVAAGKRTALLMQN